MTPSSSVRPLAAAFAGGAAIAAVSGLLVRFAVLPATDVPDDMWSHPWTPAALVPVSLLYATAHLLVAAGLVGFHRSGLAGTGRAARVGFGLSLAGMLVLTAAELASLPIREARMDETGPAVVGGVFGLATLLCATGMTLLGRATLRAGRWTGRRRFAPLAAGLAAICLLVAPATTSALALGVAAWSSCLLAWAIALLIEPAPRGAGRARGAALAADAATR